MIFLYYLIDYSLVIVSDTSMASKESIDVNDKLPIDRGDIDGIQER